MDNKERAAKLAEQISRRLEILRDWETNGVPDGYLVPISLNKVRLWADSKLGIERIGSPSSFTTSHKTYGKDVARISKLLSRLNSPAVKKKPKSNAAKLLRKERSENKVLKASLVEAANQYAALRAELDTSKKLLRVARQSQEETEALLMEAEETIRGVKTELVKERAKSDREKVTSIDLRGKRRANQDR